MHIDELLSRIRSADSRLVLLAGAGISIDLPSGLPSGYAFSSATLRRIAPNPELEKRLRSLLDVDRDGFAKLRFELLMSAIQIADSQLRVFDILDQCEAFNANHAAVARLVGAGAICLTTNFDNLLERAGLAELSRLLPVVIDAEDIGHLDDPSAGLIVKLHGSLRRYAEGGWQDVRESIVATLEAVGQLGSGFSLKPEVRNLITQALRSANLVVVGYSGSDDFDVWPLLRSARSRGALVWVIHNGGAQPTVSSVAETARSPNTSKLTRQLQDLAKIGAWKSDQIFVLEVDTSGLLMRIAGPGGSPPTADSSARSSDLNQFMDKWSVQFVSRPGIRELLCGILLLRAAATKEAEAVLLGIADLTADQRLRSQSYEYLSNLYMLIGAYERVNEFCNKLLQGPVSLRSRIRALHFLGAAAHLVGNHPAAESHLRDCIETCAASGRFGDIGSSSALYLARTWHARGHHADAKALYDKLAVTFDRGGDLYHYGLCLHQLGSLHLHLGKLDEAEQYFQHALQLRTELYDEPGIAATAHELGFLAFRRGDVRSSLRLFNESLDRERAIRNPHGIADSLAALGYVHLEIGDAVAARPYYLEAFDLDTKLGRQAEAQQDALQLSEIDRYLERKVPLMTRIAEKITRAKTNRPEP